VKLLTAYMLFDSKTVINKTEKLLVKETLWSLARSHLEILSSTTQSDRCWRPDQSTIKYISRAKRTR